MASESGGRPGVVVAALTATALAVVGFLALQANAAADRDHGDRRPQGAPSSDGKSEKERPRKPAAVPADSGEGRRIVYSLKLQRVWLVGEGEKVTRTYRVTASAVSPKPGRYQVGTRSAHITGSDGVPVENVVRFATVEGVTIGFSAALNGSTAAPDPDGPKTGGIRESRADGKALWAFASTGTPVYVVP
ncbi:hypothetical protein [Streptomyces sp. NPDC005438]|uniref:hypothetical protein n=1 Tax=Streptomyces sp. NPDC005438 TaxID=3156880 RepID=UPI0033A31818